MRPISKAPSVRGTAAVVISTVMMLGLGACSAFPPGDTLADARSVYLSYRHAIADAQLKIWTGTWRADMYGDDPIPCLDSSHYQFSLSRTTPAGWTLQTSAEDAAYATATSLQDAGWSSISVTDDSTAIDSFRVEANAEDKSVEYLVATFRSGPGGDSVLIQAQSSCRRGIASSLTKELLPGFPKDFQDFPPAPTEESPDTPPLFGYTADKTPLRITEEEWRRG